MRRLLLGLAIASAATLVTSLAAGDDQAIAKHILEKLKSEQQAGSLKGFHIDMRVDNGTVWYKGYVANSEQKTLVLVTAQRAKNLGVVQVVDDIEVRAEEVATPVSQVETLQPTPAAPATWVQEAVPQQYAQPAIPVSMPVGPGAPIGPSTYAQMPVQVDTTYEQPMPMPAAYGYAGGAPVQADNATLPAYAWPSYAAYPNYSAVTYPQQYSPTAWPYIGPFYPYPQVPLGWRKVTLEWDDGWWYLDFHNRSYPY